MSVPRAHGERIAAEFRRQTPALSRKAGGLVPVYLDAPGGSQMPAPVLDAIAGYVRQGMANRHGAFETSTETEELLATARDQVRALLNAPGYAIVFGQNMTALSFALATSVARDWQPGGRRDQVVVSEIDHHANVDPWLSVADDRGMQARWLPVDVPSVSLDLSQLETIITSRCAVTAVSLASNAVGTIQNVAAITARARDCGAITVVDAVHAIPHLPVDVEALGADVVLFSAYKAFGPHIGVMAIREGLLDRIRFYKVAPAPDAGPDKAELGSQNHEAVAGLSAAITFLASLGKGSSLRQRIVSTMQAVSEYEDGLARVLHDSLAALPGVSIFRAPRAAQKTPTIAFTLAGTSPREIAQGCGEHGIFTTNGDFYATTLARRAGVSTSGGWVRIGIAPYITPQDIGRTITVLEQITSSHQRQARPA